MTDSTAALFVDLRFIRYATYVRICMYVHTRRFMPPDAAAPAATVLTGRNNPPTEYRWVVDQQAGGRGETASVLLEGALSTRHEAERATAN
jgi:hypothetical protein